MIRAPQPLYDTETLERFCEYVETLEIAHASLRRGGNVRLRITLISLHSLAEVLLYGLAHDMFVSDDWTLWFMPPKYTSVQKDDARSDFRRRVALLEREKVLSKDDGVVLRVSHTRRNPAYHRWAYRPEIARLLSTLLIPVCLGLLRRLFGARGVGGGKESRYRWLRKYGVTSRYVEFKSVIASVAVRLMPSGVIDWRQARSVLSAELTGRILELRQRIARDLFGPATQALDEILRQEEFADGFDSLSASDELRAVHYRISRHEPVDRQEYLQTEELYNTRTKTALADFTPTMRSHELDSLERRISKFAGLQPKSSVLLRYSDLDESLSLYEAIIDNAANRLDHEISRQVDLMRGK